MKKIIFSLLIFCLWGVDCAVAQNANKLVVASFNIRYANSGDSIKGNGWDQRGPVILDLLKYNNFDIFGAQEVLHRQLVDLQAGLSDYAHIGIGRDDGKTQGEYSPIFYKKDKFDVLDSGTFWLSTETTYPNKGWDAALPRICSWGQLKDKEAGYVVWFFNLHMDHIGVEARKESAKLILSKIEAQCQPEDIVVLTGDFNVDQTNESYVLLHNSEMLNDSYEEAKHRYATTGTFNRFDANLKTNSRIDHIFVSPKVTVERYAVLTDTYRGEVENSETIKDASFPKEVSLQQYIARMPSDHFPIVVEISF